MWNGTAIFILLEKRKLILAQLGTGIKCVKMSGLGTGAKPDKMSENDPVPKTGQIGKEGIINYVF